MFTTCDKKGRHQELYIYTETQKLVFLSLPACFKESVHETETPEN